MIDQRFRLLQETRKKNSEEIHYYEVEIKHKILLKIHFVKLLTPNLRESLVLDNGDWFKWRVSEWVSHQHGYTTEINSKKRLNVVTMWPEYNAC